MSSKHKTVAILPAKNNESVNQIEVSVSYQLDGRRGFFLHVQPVEVSGYFKTAMPMEGVRYFIESATRFNQKRFEALCEKYSNWEHHKFLVSHAIAQSRYGLELVTEAGQAA